MLSELCKELNNWFNYNLPKNIGTHKIENGRLVRNYGLLDGQYFRIIGSVFNDGVYQYPATGLTDETFDGGVWSMAVPPEVVALSNNIDNWKAKYADVDSAAMSPYTSESFGGYSYTKSSGGSSDGTSNAGTWQAAFKNQLRQWRKLPPW